MRNEEIHLESLYVEMPDPACDLPAGVGDSAFVQQRLANPPAWAGEKLKPWRDAFPLSLRPFITHEYWTESGSINVFHIVGTDDPRYQGSSWLELLCRGERMAENLALLQSNPDYYLSPCIRDPRMDFRTTDGLHYYIGGDGYHRACLARFFLSEKGKSQLHWVTITQYHVDWAFYETCRQLQRLQPLIVPEAVICADRQSLSREDGPGWKTDRFRSVITWTEAGQTSHLDHEQALQKLHELLIGLGQERFRQKTLPQRLRLAFKPHQREQP